LPQKPLWHSAPRLHAEPSAPSPQLPSEPLAELERTQIALSQSAPSLQAAPWRPSLQRPTNDAEGNTH
jgi:hypothetical protein